MRILALVPLLFLAPAPLPVPTVPFPEWNYQELQIEGWTVFVQDELFEEEALRVQVLGLMKIRLWEVATRLPAPTVQRLREVELRMHLDHSENNGAAYHPNPDWLRRHDMPENWALGIEFGNARNFLSWSRQQPAMVLHELAHAWHHQVLGYGDEGVLEAFTAVKESGALEEVLFATGGKRRAYALNNQMEFFAEMSEAWWSTNDFYPFVKGELMDAFPDVAESMGGWWKRPAEESR
ncbi:MAG: hypothetical protein ACI8QS_001293 [Planctomycetota bacterium]|jgi:hypothetical protein